MSLMNAIKGEEFTKDEVENILKHLSDFRDVKDHLSEQVQKYFQEFDTDSSGYLDKRELRKFLEKFFSTYKIHFPVTDEYVDAVFRDIDQNRDNKIQPNELEQYAMHFVNQLIPEYERISKDKQWDTSMQLIFPQFL